jgi:hypothetical protein
LHERLPVFLSGILGKALGKAMKKEKTRANSGTGG